MKFDLANFADNYLPEDPHQISAREKGEELGALDATPGSGAFLKYIASLISAQSVVEIGTGSGVGTLWLLKGVINSGVITTIDPEVQHIQVARQVLNEADIAPNRYRLITSDYLDVMRKLADRAYDLVVFRGAPEDILDVIDEAHRILLGYCLRFGSRKSKCAHRSISSCEPSGEMKLRVHPTQQYG